MGMGLKSANGSRGYKRLQSSKYMTLSGTVLAVFSSSLLYANLIWYFLWPDSLSKLVGERVFHPFVFGFYLYSGINTVGVLLVCGWAKKYMDQSTKISMHNLKKGGKGFARRLSKMAPKRSSFQFDSRAYETDN
jgi:hypothetical protein